MAAVCLWLSSGFAAGIATISRWAGGTGEGISPPTRPARETRDIISGGDEVTKKTTVEELERLWTWTGDIIEELEELRETISRLYSDEEETPLGLGAKTISEVR